MRLDEKPSLVFWEMTRACDLACAHCRAVAVPWRDAGELTREEGFRLSDQLAAARVPLLILTGGDPAKRADLDDQIRHAVQRGLRVAVTLSPTPLVTDGVLASVRAAGAVRVAISLDGHVAETHDAFRRQPGSFEHALRILRGAAAVGLETQVNTTVHPGTRPHLRDVAEVVRATGAVMWSVFFVVPVGRATVTFPETAEDTERALVELADIAETAPFRVKTTAAPQYRRVLAQRAEQGRKQQREPPRTAPRLNDGKGLLFVSHVGEIYPSGFLPLPCGNVRTHDPIDVYRYHPTFRALRDVESLTGKCGECEYRSACGGSRARAHATSGRMLASDPSCAYEPRRAEIRADSP